MKGIRLCSLELKLQCSLSGHELCIAAWLEEMEFLPTPLDALRILPQGEIFSMLGVCIWMGGLLCRFFSQEISD
jgi:hypothetical protein